VLGDDDGPPLEEDGREPREEEVRVHDVVSALQTQTA
jgi:hypothetical protein